MINCASIENISDIDLIELSKEGDQFAFKEIVRRNKSRIAATIYGMIGRCEEAEDIGQEVFIRFYRSMNNFKGESSLSTYLTRIAINLSLNEIKKQKRKRFFSFHKMLEEGTDLEGQETPLMFNESREIINNAVAKLNAKYRPVIVLRLIDGYSTEETAKILDLPFGTVLSRLARGQKILKELLTPYGDIL